MMIIILIIQIVAIIQTITIITNIIHILIVLLPAIGRTDKAADRQCADQRGGARARRDLTRSVVT